MDFNTFVRTRKLVGCSDAANVIGYGPYNSWQILNSYDSDLYYICGEEFHLLEEAEHKLYQMYQDELMLTEGY